MKRKGEIQECKSLLADKSTDHLHIRRKAITTGFTNDLKTDLEQYKVISVDIHEWTYSELMETLRYELQKELSRLKYYLSCIKSLTFSFFGVSGGAGVEVRPDYSRTTDYLYEVSNQIESPLAIFINYHGNEQIDGFGWVPKLDIPEDATIVTDGFQECVLDDSSKFEIGRLSETQTVEYLTELRRDIHEEEATKIHRIHDGNPVAIEIANERGLLGEQLTGEALRKLWSRVYDDKISGDELDLLTESSHLIDLDQRDVATVTDKTRGEAKELLRQLENKGVVSKKQSGLFTTDQYVKRYTATQLTGREFSEQHRMSFHDYVEKWIDAHGSRMEEMRNKAEKGEGGELVSPPDLYTGLADPNLFLAVHHFSETHDEIDNQTFVEELEEINGETSGVFTFGIIAQRFFFENPTEVIQDLAESILGIDGDIENELFSGTLGILFDFDLQQFISQLAEGWSGDINTSSLDTANVSKPNEVVKKIQQGIDTDLFHNLPSDVKMAISQLVALAVIDSRTAREYFNKFGKTAQKYGLEEEPFCLWLEEVRKLVDELNPETEIEASDKEDLDPHQESLESLNSEIRDRIDLRRYLEKNRSQTQREFQQRVEQIRGKPDEIAEQYIRCGECLAETKNSLFPFLWFAFGHKIFAKVVLGGENWQIYGKYKQWSGAREEKERNLNENELVITKDEIEARLE